MKHPKDMGTAEVEAFDDVDHGTTGFACRIPDECIDSKRYPLFMARDVMRAVIQGFQSTAG